ncbi:AAA family ATPase, partial [Labrys portucalensis]
MLGLNHGPPVMALRFVHSYILKFRQNGGKIGATNISQSTAVERFYARAPWCDTFVRPKVAVSCWKMILGGLVPIQRIIVKNYRTLKHADVAFNDDVNIIVGNNEAGKSTLLEAINLWPAAGFVDIEIRCLTELESGNATKE